MRGQRLTAPEGDSAMTRVEARLTWARGRLERNTSLAAVDALVPAGGMVVDAGAERGFFTARPAGLVGPGGRGHAFEPNPWPRANIETTVAGEPNVVVHPVALSDAAGSAELHVPVEDGEHLFALG